MQQDNPLIATLVEKVAQRIASEEYPYIEAQDLQDIERNIDIAFVLMELLTLKSQLGQAPSEILQETYLVIISEILAFIYDAIEQEHSWAVEFSKQFQHYIANYVLQPTVQEAVIYNVLEILHQSELDIIEPIREANARLVQHQMQQYPIGSDNLIELLEEIATMSDGCPFNFYKQLISQTHQLIPQEVQLLLLQEMFNTRNPVIQEVAVLMLLHPDKAIREHVPHLIAQHVGIVSAKNLRRMIIIRSWLPEEERPALDELIKYARRKGSNCEPWPKGSVIEVIATGFDGTGTQNILILSQRNEEWALSGLILKENSGIREPILFNVRGILEIEQIKKEMLEQTGAHSVGIEYLNYAIPHFIHIGIMKNHPPSPFLLFLTEKIGISHWHSEGLNESLLLETLGTQAGSPFHSPAITQEIINESGHWINQNIYLQSWFEHDAGVHQVMSELAHLSETTTLRGTADRLLINALCEKILEPRRKKWFRRLLWMTIWAKMGKSITPNWQYFFVLTQVIHAGVPLSRLPLMQQVAMKTSQMAFGSEKS